MEIRPASPASPRPSGRMQRHRKTLGERGLSRLAGAEQASHTVLGRNGKGARTREAGALGASGASQ
jgi:hypothetical protein